ncbi:MAG: glycoside hydrolase family 3 N-terminal domain-containing protein [Lacipirellulaceae bacterium]
MHALLCSTPFTRHVGSLVAVAALAAPLCCAGRLAAAAEGLVDFNPALPKAGAKPETRSEEGPVVPLGIDWTEGTIDERVERALGLMTLSEKIGQLVQVASAGETLPSEIAADVRQGRIGSLFYTGSTAHVREAQRIATKESRLGLPLLVPRDVIHGFRTVFPIPLGQAAAWSPELAEQAATVAAAEARSRGVNWTFAPMMDVTRDARWGRIAESLGEDPLVASQFAAAMVRGYQRPLADGSPGIAACAKHFVGYGLSEGGRDYNRAELSTSELHSVFLAPFRAAIDAGCDTVMTGFSTVNGVPASGHEELVRQVLKRRWGFDGLVVSDWGSVLELVEHGFADGPSEAAELALLAGVDMEMASSTYRDHLRSHVEAGRVPVELIDDAVRRVLRVKFEYALVPIPARGDDAGLAPTKESISLARRIARESMVLLKNDGGVLPLDSMKLKRVAIVGPLADAARDQLGCWMLDGKVEESVTPRGGLVEAFRGKVEVSFEGALKDPLDASRDGIAKAVAAAHGADVAIVCVGEGWLWSGEARSRADLTLPGLQSELVERVAETGTPTVVVFLAGRPLTIGAEVQSADAALFAWHPGSQGGPALADLLLGVESPSGRLPVTFPKQVGQAPLYYNHPSTGRPPLPGTRGLVETGLADFPEEQKYRSHYVDVDPFPLFPFGYGLTYGDFVYEGLEVSTATIEPGQTLAVRARLTNRGARAATEVAQLYVQDVAARIVRPVRELKDHRRITLEPGESTVVEFALSTDQLAYFDNNARRVLEPGKFRVGIGGSASAPLGGEFVLRDPAIAKSAASASADAQTR